MGEQTLHVGRWIDVTIVLPLQMFRHSSVLVSLHSLRAEFPALESMFHRSFQLLSLRTFEGAPAVDFNQVSIYS